MNLDSLPSQVEVMGWNPRTLADLMRRLKLSGCDKVVMRSNITGAQFMQMTERELQGFPSIYVPMITKVQSDINSSERDQKKAIGHRLQTLMFPKQAFVQEEDAWDSDEFDYESDKDNDDAEEEKWEDSEQMEGDYEVPSTTDTNQPQHLNDYTETVPEPSPARRPALPPPQGHKPSPQPRAVGPNVMHSPLPRMEHALKLPAIPHAAERSKKPPPPKKDQSTLKGSNVTYSGLPTCKLSVPRGPKPTDLSQIRRQAPAIPAGTPPFARAKPEPEKGLDPSWYGGMLTRRQAEVALRQMNEDGAFVVRDSSKGSTVHPYTLMVLKEGKVYNIKIQNISNSYTLGTNLDRSQSFPGVREMITHHTRTPLFLIDATDRSSGAQNQCCLLHPVGI